jgi:predicted DNA-binding transcriptional regulator YafY
MKFLEMTERLKELDKMITKGQAICPSSIAKKFNTTSRSAISMVNLLKDLGAPVYYCRRTKKYCYAIKGSLFIKWIPESEKGK